MNDLLWNDESRDDEGISVSQYSTNNIDSQLIVRQKYDATKVTSGFAKTSAKFLPITACYKH